MLTRLQNLWFNLDVSLIVTNYVYNWWQYLPCVPAMWASTKSQWRINSQLPSDIKDAKSFIHYCKQELHPNTRAVHCEAGARRANCLHQWVHGIRHTTPAWSSLDSWGCLHGSLPHSVRLWQGQDRLRGICMSVSALCSVSVASLSATCRQYTANKWIAKNAKTGNMI